MFSLVHNLRVAPGEIQAQQEDMASAPLGAGVGARYHADGARFVDQNAGDQVT
jgi:hypothetical protein